jgi:flagellum-specific ATP synthase
VFAKLPQLVERAGTGRAGSGSITAFYTVLTEGDDQQDPIADSARAILDGHVVLSRRIAESGQYPAIDVEASISRVMHDIVPRSQSDAARRLKQMLSTWQQNRDLLAIGAYQRGADPRVDAAIELWPRVQQFLMQDMGDSVSYADSVAQLVALAGDGS